MRPMYRSALAGVALSLAACGPDGTAPVTAPNQLELTSAQVHALDSTGQVIVQANPNDGAIKSLVDSTLLVLTSGVVAKRLDIVTNLTSAPLYFLAVHRVVIRNTGGSFSTWNLVGMDDPGHVTNIVEVSGFAQSNTPVAPTAVTGVIGDGAGVVNAVLMSVGTAGAVTEWFGSAGPVSFTSGAAGAACPGFVATANVTCNLETIRAHFSVSAASGSQGAGARSASVATDVDVPAMQLTFRF